jgi:hypothetical protein
MLLTLSVLFSNVCFVSVHFPSNKKEAELSDSVTRGTHFRMSELGNSSFYLVVLLTESS